MKPTSEIEAMNYMTLIHLIIHTHTHLLKMQNNPTQIDKIPARQPYIQNHSLCEN